MQKMQNLVLTLDLDSAGSIYPLRVPYEALEAAQRKFDVFWDEAHVTSTYLRGLYVAWM